MTELRIALSLEAMQALAGGTELVLDLDEHETRLFLSCDEACIDTFQAQVHQALMRLLPTGPNKH